MIPRPKDMTDLIAAARRFEEHFEQLTRALQANSIATRELAHQVATHNEAARLERRLRTVK